MRLRFRYSFPLSFFLDPGWSSRIAYIYFSSSDLMTCVQLDQSMYSTMISPKVRERKDTEASSHLKVLKKIGLLLGSNLMCC